MIFDLKMLVFNILLHFSLSFKDVFGQFLEILIVILKKMMSIFQNLANCYEIST